MPIVPELCSGMGTLFGGCGLGALVETLEQDAGRPVVWATAQYLAFARHPSVLDIEVTLAVEGRSVTQARAIGRVDGEEILTVNAALGRRTSPIEGQWAERPDVPPPGDCPPRRLQTRHEGSILARLDTRLADARDPEDFPSAPGAGRSALWVRFPDLDLSAAALAVVGDYVPFGISQASGQRAGGNSLDNTIRVVEAAPTEWILADVRIHAVGHGFAHGLVHLWGEDGTLLATASQSAVVRAWRDQPPADGRST
jgi:acyl-CoA thioesterase